jgi:hypothetical protein
MAPKHYNRNVKKDDFIYGIYDDRDRDATGAVRKHILKSAVDAAGNPLGDREIHVDSGEKPYCVCDEFAVCTVKNGKTLLFANAKRPVQMRKWEEFEESKTSSLDDFIRNNSAKGLCPKYKIWTRDVIISDENKFYSGFTYDRETGRVQVGEGVREDRLPDHEEKTLKQTFYFFSNDDRRKEIKFNGDQFVLVNPFKNVTTDELLADENIWRKLPIDDGCERGAEAEDDEPLSGGGMIGANVGDSVERAISGRPQATGDATSDTAGLTGKNSSHESAGNKDDDKWDETEISFLKSFEQYVKRCGFKYSTADLVRLHTSVKCSMCTLLAGNPGTGKSSLAELYMRAVADSPEKNEAERSWRQIFVNPAWMEPADLLGYETDSGFRHAPSHLAEFIRNISEGENLPMGIVCFEEMNLACVEHYFSDFIQIMSRGMGVIPGCKEKERDLFVGRNFRVIGTCNSDETTRPLSPRFLSRCNTIELASSFETTKKLVTDLADGNAPEIKPFVGREPITYGTFKRWCESSRDIDNIIVNAILSLLGPKDGNESIMSDAGFDMSGRIVSDMFTYIRNRPPYEGNNSFLTETDRQKVALDEFLAQRVFFASRPTPGTITAIRALMDTVNNGFEIEEIGKDDQNVSKDLLKLPLSAELLKRRIDDYERVMQV